MLFGYPLGFRRCENISIGSIFCFKEILLISSRKSLLHFFCWRMRYFNGGRCSRGFWSKSTAFLKKKYSSENCCENISESFVQVSNRRYLSGRSHNRRRHCHNKNQVDWKRVDFLVVHLHSCYVSAFSETKGKVICDD